MPKSSVKITFIPLLVKLRNIMFRCEEYIKSRENLDIDAPPPSLWEHQWEQFLTEYYTLTQGGARIQVCVHLVGTYGIFMYTNLWNKSILDHGVTQTLFNILHLYFTNTGQSVSIPCHSQTRTKHVDLVTLET